MRAIKVFLGVVAVVLLLGLVVGLLPVSTTCVNCGSAFADSNDALVQDYVDSTFNRWSTETSHTAACDSLRSVLRIPAVILILGGAAALLGALVRHGMMPARHS